MFDNLYQYSSKSKGTSSKKSSSQFGLSNYMLGQGKATQKGKRLNSQMHQSHHMLDSSDSGKDGYNLSYIKYKKILVKEEDQRIERENFLQQQSTAKTFSKKP